MAYHVGMTTASTSLAAVPLDDLSRGLLDMLQRQDPEVTNLLAQEAERQASTLELIASENHVSTAVMHAVGTWMTNKYAEGYPGKRYYGGCVFHDQVEDLARSRATQLFGCRFANVQPHSAQTRTSLPSWRCWRPATRCSPCPSNPAGI